MSIELIKKLFLGLIIGIASVTPGLSGGVIAAAMGLYEPAVRAIVNVKKEFQKSVSFLLPLGVGVGVAIILFSRVMQGLMERAPFEVLYVFFGLMMGSLPSLIKEANQNGFRVKYLWAMVIALTAVLCIDQFKVLVSNDFSNVELGITNTILYGAVLAVGTIVPGISSSFILMYLGVYEELLAAIASLNFQILILLAAGFGITALLIIKLVEVLFCKYHGFSYYVVLGLLLGSMIVVFPGIRTGWNLVGDVFLFLASTAVSFGVIVMNNKGFMKQG